jgi:hypothetical protein
MSDKIFVFYGQKRLRDKLKERKAELRKRRRKDRIKEKHKEIILSVAITTS